MTEMLKVGNSIISIKKVGTEDYISLTDIAKGKNSEFPADVIKNWIRSKSTIDYLGLWEKMNNENFKLVEFDQFRSQAGDRSFVLSPQKWIDSTNAIGVKSSSGRYGGTYAQKDIAMEFASYISPEFKLYLIKEFQRLKEIEQARLEPEWNLNRMLSKINYKIHTDSIKQNLIDGKILDNGKKGFKYANEADLLNIAVFGKTNKQWREETGINTKKKNIREYASLEELIILSNCEYLNSTLIERKLTPDERLNILRNEVEKQMRILLGNRAVESIKGDESFLNIHKSI